MVSRLIFWLYRWQQHRSGVPTTEYTFSTPIRTEYTTKST
jgi:hypothetical protein